MPVRANATMIQDITIEVKDSAMQREGKCSLNYPIFTPKAAHFCVFSG
jgi:hypothetical protein